jgi:alkylated DNA repair dioxygenase AlkB
MATQDQQVHDLADGGKLVYLPSFLAPEVAQRYFEELRDTAPWKQEKAAWGRLQPRLTASYGDQGVTYYYSRTVNVANPWTETLLEMKRKIEEVIPRFEQATTFNFCLLNRYRNGMDSVGMHADDEPGMCNVIGSLSLGATRTFKIRHNKQKKLKMEFAACHGSLILMGGTMQQCWKHGVDKEPEVEGERINLTFRRMEG